MSAAAQAHGCSQAPTRQPGPDSMSLEASVELGRDRFDERRRNSTRAMPSVAPRLADRGLGGLLFYGLDCGGQPTSPIGCPR